MIPTEVREQIKANVRSMPLRVEAMSEGHQKITMGGISWYDLAMWAVPDCRRSRSGWTGWYGSIYRTSCQAQGRCCRNSNGKNVAQWYSCQEHYSKNGRLVKWKEGWPSTGVPQYQCYS